jgi:hypothetical protein
MSILRILWKLMSKHLLYHLVLPLIFGLTVEAVIAWRRDPSSFELLEYLFSTERIGLYAGILIAYLGIALLLVQKEAKPPWDNTLTEQLDQVLKGATGFFATCTIPMKQWFDPYTQQYFSHIVKHQLNTGAFPQQRVLLFTRRGELAKAKEQYLDGHYAKPLAEIHKNYGIKLGFLDRSQINEIRSRIVCPKLDFALVNYPNSRRVYTFDKRGAKIKLAVLSTPKQIAPFEVLIDAIKQKVFDASGELNPEHKFAP